jgi:hypothetical protein
MDKQLCRQIHGGWGALSAAPLAEDPGEPEDNNASRRLTADEQRIVGLPPLSSPDPSLSSIRYCLA